MQNCNNKKRHKKKRQAVTQVAFEVDRGYQHNKKANAKEQTDTTGKNENTSLIKRDFPGRGDTPIYPFFKSCPQTIPVAMFRTLLREKAH